MSDDEIRIAALEARVAALETEIGALTDQIRSSVATGDRRPPSHGATGLAPPPPPPSARPVAMGAGPPSPAPQPPRRQVHVDSETLLKWGGLGLVVLAVAFVVSTAIQRGWIGPVLQLIGAVGISGSLIGIGVRLRDERRPWAHALSSGGVAALFVTFASSLFLEQASVDLAFVLTLLVGFGALQLARVLDSEWVGATALAGSVIAWLVIADGTAPFIESGAALVVGLLAVVVVAVERGWFGLRLMAELTGLVSVLAFAVAADGANEQLATLVAAAFVTAVVVIVPNRGELAGSWRSLEVRVSTLLAPWAWVALVILFFDSDRAPGWVALGVAAVVVTVCAVGRSRLLEPHLVALLVGASVCTTAGLGILLSTETAWLAVAVQGVGLLLVSRALDAGWLMNLNAAILLVIAGLFAATDGIDAWSVDTTLGADLARLGVIVAVAAAVWLAGLDEIRRIGSGVVLALVLVWLGSVLVHLPEGQGAVSLSWAVVGVSILVLGAVRKLPDMGTAGLLVLALTVAKLLLVDMAEVDTLWRAGLFLIVGLVLLRLGFLLPRLTAATADRTASD